MSNMSRAEAISILKKLKLDVEDYGKESDFVKQAVEAFDTAIASLETDEAYQLEYEQSEFCANCIDRKTLLAELDKRMKNFKGFVGSCNGIISGIYQFVQGMPSVLPKADKPTIIDWNNCHTSEQLDSIATTKNDLGVDWESYKDVDGNCLDDLILEVLQNNFDCGNTYGYKVADEIIGLLPSVTPQEPKTGHWNEIPKYKDIAWRCSECEHFTTMKHNYCPNCGCRMVEPQESGDKE